MWAVPDRLVAAVAFGDDIIIEVRRPVGPQADNEHLSRVLVRNNLDEPAVCGAWHFDPHRSDLAARAFGHHQTVVVIVFAVGRYSHITLHRATHAKGCQPS